MLKPHNSYINVFTDVLASCQVVSFTSWNLLAVLTYAVGHHALYQHIFGCRNICYIIVAYEYKRGNCHAISKVPIKCCGRFAKKRCNFGKDSYQNYPLTFCKYNVLNDTSLEICYLLLQCYKSSAVGLYECLSWVRLILPFLSTYPSSLYRESKSTMQFVVASAYPSVAHNTYLTAK